MNLQKTHYHHGNAREALLDAATGLIRNKGMSAFSLRAVAREVGVDPATCYRHFKNKEAILHGIARRGFTQLSQVMKQASSSCSGKETVFMMGKSYVQFATDDPLVFQVMFGGCGLPALDKRLREPSVDATAFEQLKDALTLHLAQNSDDQPSLDEVAMEVWSAVHGIAALVAFEAILIDQATIDAMVVRMIRALL